MKKLILFLFLICTIAYAAVPEKLRTDVFQLGVSGSTALKEIIFDVGDGATNPTIEVNATSKDFVFTKESTVQGAFTSEGDLTVGDGVANDKLFTFDIGAGASNPFFKWDNTQGKLVFSNDGSLEKKIGSGSGGGGAGGINLLANNGAEDGLLSWTNTGGTFTQESYTNSTEDNAKYFRLVATGAGEYAQQIIAAWPDFISGGCMADIKYLQGDNAFEYKVIEDPSGTPVELSSGTISDLTSWLKAPTITFDCPTAGNAVALRIISTSAGTIDFDEAYLGSNKNINPVGKMSHILASFKLEGNDGRVISANTEDVYFSGSGTGWTSSGDNNYYTVQGDDTVIYINGSTSATTAADRDALLYKNGALYKFLMDFRSTRYSGVQDFMYNSSKGEFAKGDTLHIRMGNEFTLDNNSTAHYLNITEVKIGNQGSETTEAFTPEQADFFVEADHIGSTLFTFSHTTNGPFINSSIVLNQRVGSSSIICDDGSVGGSTCSTGNELMGISVDIPVAGRYEACIDFTADSNATVVQYYKMSVVDPSDPLVVLQEEPSERSVNGAVTNLRDVAHVCGTFVIPSTGKTGFVLRGRISSSSGDILTDTAKWSVRMISHNVSRPVVQNMVDTSVGFGVRINGCVIRNNGTASTDHSMCGSWINSVNRSSIGLVDISFLLGIYSGTPLCWGANLSSDDILTVTSALSSGITMRNSYPTGGGGSIERDQDFYLFCMGER